jgi:5'-nucleotidase
MSKPFIFVTNDDGIFAPGIRKLIGLMKNIGKVMVVAPDKPQSGKGHAITMDIPLRIKKIAEDTDYTEYSCNGTPVDSIKLGLSLCKGNMPDLIVSGINHGANSSINIIYSGTMAAAIEGAIEGIPSIGFSFTDFSPDANLEAALPYVEKIARLTIDKKLPPTVSLNVNIPALNGAPIKGIKVCRQAHAMWNERFELRKDPHHQEYYWLSGEFENLDNKEDTDEWALKNGYISVVPVHTDMTAHKEIANLNKWDFNAE